MNLGKIVENVAKGSISLLIKLFTQRFHIIKMNRFYSKNRKGVE